MSEEIKWRKIGGGSFRPKNSKKIIKPNQTFMAKVEDIPEAFRDVVIPVGELPEEKVIPSKTEFELKEKDFLAKDCEEGLTYIIPNEDGEDIEVTCVSVGEETVLFEDKEENGYETEVTDPVKTVPQDDPVKTGEHEIQPSSPGWFNVVNIATGKPINDKGLRKAEAEKLLEELS